MASRRSVESPVSHGPLTLYPARWEALLDGKPLRLSPTEFRILCLLVIHPRTALLRAELLEACGEGVVHNRRNVDVHVSSIRRRLGRHAGLIETVPAVGYRIQTPAGPPRMRTRARAAMWDDEARTTHGKAIAASWGRMTPAHRKARAAAMRAGHRKAKRAGAKARP